MLAGFLATSASAQVDYHWTGAGDATSWSQAANWLEGMPPQASDAHAVFIGTGFPTTSPLPIVIGASDVVQLTDQIFGPEWGQTLNIYGNVNVGFGMALVGDMTSTPTSILNLYGTGSVTSGDSFFLGDMFWFAGAPNVAVNMYDNSSITANWWGVGGHLNLYGGTATANIGFLTGTPTAGAWGGAASSDATRMVNLAGGKLVILGDITGTGNQLDDMMTRGIIEAYGGSGTINADLVSQPGYTVLTGIIPEPSSLALLLLGGLSVVVGRRTGSTR
jgi:hypothetical protein